MKIRRSKSTQSGVSSGPKKKVIQRKSVVADSVLVQPVKDIVTTETEVTTVPEVEIRRPATLAQALTQPPVAVVKPKSKVRRKVVSRKRVA